MKEKNQCFKIQVSRGTESAAAVMIELVRALISSSSLSTDDGFFCVIANHNITWMCTSRCDLGFKLCKDVLCKM